MAEKKNVIDIADLFCTSREREGVWFEPEIEGIGVGFEFKTYGFSSDQNTLAAEEYKKQHELLEKETDRVKKTNKEIELICNRIAAMITDIRPKGENEVRINGEPIKYSPELVYQILYENEDIRTDMFTKYSTPTNFMKKKL